MKRVFHLPVGLLSATAAASIAGFFLRRYQLAHELQGNGSLKPGSVMHIVLGVLSAALLLGFLLSLRKMQGKSTCKEVFSRATAVLLTQLLCVAALIAGNVLLFGYVPSASTPFFTLLWQVLPFLGGAAGGCILLFSSLHACGRKPWRGLYMLACVYLVVRLILNFQQWSLDPSIHDYGFRLLADICCMIGLYHIAGFGFSRGKRRTTLFWTLGTVFFCAISLADAFAMPDKSELFILLGLGGSQLLTSAQLLLHEESVEI
jgi:hypothetical protein